MTSSRMKIAVMTGALLGVVCIIGAQLRSGFAWEPVALFAFWYNRLLMGVMIGLAPEGKKLSRALVRSGGLGLLVSFAFYVSTGFKDPVGFWVGLPYGLVIETVASRFRRAS
jgi:hypothetical protein